MSRQGKYINKKYKVFQQSPDVDNLESLMKHENLVRKEFRKNRDTEEALKTTGFMRKLKSDIKMTDRVIAKGKNAILQNVVQDFSKEFVKPDP